MLSRDKLKVAGAVGVMGLAQLVGVPRANAQPEVAQPTPHATFDQPNAPPAILSGLTVPGRTEASVSQTRFTGPTAQSTIATQGPVVRNPNDPSHASDASVWKRLLPVLGGTAVGLSLYGLFGQGMQLARTIGRQTTEGLSLVDSEMRVWGKIPWVFTALSQAKVDPWLLGQNVAAIALCAAQLALFVKFPPRSMSNSLRVAGVMGLTAGAVAVTSVARDQIQNFGAFYDALPVGISVLALLAGNLHQHKVNKETGHTRALSLHRTAAFVSTNAAWGAYGAVKWLADGASGAWPIVAVAVLGTTLNTRILIDILKSRRAERAQREQNATA